MTVSGAIIKWMKEFNPEEYWKMSHIDTDLMHGNVDYALVKEPVTNVKTYISGTEVHTEHYQIRARLDAQTNTNCVDNNTWMETFTEWIGSRNKEKIFPLIPAVAVQEIGVSSPYYMGRSEDNKAIYQLTIFIKYMKKGD